MTPPRLSRRFLMFGPLLGLWFGAMAALFYMPLVGWRAAVAIGTVVGVLHAAGIAYTVHRSLHGTAQGLLASLGTFALVFVQAPAAVGAVAKTVGDLLSHWPWVVLCAALSLLLAMLGSTLQEQRRLRSAGEGGECARDSIDLRRGFVFDSAPPAPMSIPWLRSPWFVAALAVNLVPLSRALGATDRQLGMWLPIAGIAIAAWLVMSLPGPLLARALYVRQLERQRGVTLVHPEVAQLQQLRRSWWLSRLLMPPDPPQALSPVRQPRRRR